MFWQRNDGIIKTRIKQLSCFSYLFNRSTLMIQHIRPPTFLKASPSPGVRVPLVKNLRYYRLLGCIKLSVSSLHTVSPSLSSCTDAHRVHCTSRAPCESCRPRSCSRSWRTSRSGNRYGRCTACDGSHHSCCSVDQNRLDTCHRCVHQPLKIYRMKRNITPTLNKLVS